MPAAVYREYFPGAFLAPAVECFWTSRLVASDADVGCYRVLPDGCMDLLFDFRAVDGWRASVVGTMTRPLIAATQGQVEMLGVRFRPGAVGAFVSMNAPDLTDERIGLQNFWGRQASEIWHRLAEAEPSKRVSQLAAILEGRAGDRLQIDPFVRHCVNRIDAVRGNLRIAELEASTGLSGRQLERKFATHLGVSPKMFARVVRFKAVVAAIDRTGEPEWAGLAADLGFSDQSHLTREFKALSGFSPTNHSIS